MATTTPNYGWSVPTSTDLVKDGATAIETLGDAIDASLLDLKGGTTNQVLAKNSDTDMDFKWVADAAGMTNPMTTTGDMIYSSSGSTPARLGIGTAGQVVGIAAGVPAWTTPSGSITLLTTTALTGGVNSVVITGISQSYKKLVIQCRDLDAGTTDTRFNFMFRDTGGNDLIASMSGISQATINAQNNAADLPFPLFTSAEMDGSRLHAFTVDLWDYTSAKKKTYSAAGIYDNTTGTNNVGYIAAGGVVGAAIHQFRIYTDNAANFTNGEVLIYGVN
jgi:hypothetical protein